MIEVLSTGKIQAFENEKSVEIEYEVCQYDDDHTTVTISKGYITGFEEFDIEHLIDFGLMDDEPDKKFYWCTGGMGYPSLYCRCEDVQNIVKGWLKTQD